mgnify:CR=1 FL=1
MYKLLSGIYFDKISNDDLKTFLAQNDISDISDELLGMADGSIKKALEINENKESYYSLENIMNNIISDK